MVTSSDASLWKLFRDQAERRSGIGLKLFGFIADLAFTIMPESCSGSSPNAVRNHFGIEFTFDRDSSGESCHCPVIRFLN